MYRRTNFFVGRIQLKKALKKAMVHTLHGKSCFSRKLFVTLSSVMVSRQKENRMSKLFYVVNLDGRQSGQANDSANIVMRTKEKISQWRNAGESAARSRMGT